MVVDGRLIACRAVYFFLVTAASGLIRYLVVFLNGLDFNAFQIGIVAALRPGVGFFASFFWGYLADLFESRLSFLIVGNVVSSVGLGAMLFPMIQDNLLYLSCVMVVVTWFGSVTALLDAILLTILQEPSENTNTNTNTNTTNNNDTNSSNDGSSDSEASKKENKSGQYGATRLWGAVGWGLGSLICGFLVTGFGENFIVFFYEFNMAIVIAILSFIFPCVMKSTKIKNERKLHLQKDSLLWNEYNPTDEQIANMVQNVNETNENQNNYDPNNDENQQNNDYYSQNNQGNHDHNNINNDQRNPSNGVVNDSCKDIQNNENNNTTNTNTNDTSDMKHNDFESSDAPTNLFATPLISSPVLHFPENDDIGDFDKYLENPQEYTKRHKNIEMDLLAEKKKQTLFSEFVGNICNFNGIVFLANLLLFGTAMSFVENYLFLFLIQKLDAPVYLCGLTITVMVLGEVPIFRASNWLLKKIGILGLLWLSHAAYIIRVFGYTLLPHGERKYSYFILLLEPLHGLTYAGMWLASVEYGARIVPTHLQGTMQGLLGGIYNGLGDSFGSLVGGYIYNTYGPVWMYRHTGAIIFLWMIIFQVTFRLGLKCNKKKRKQKRQRKSEQFLNDLDYNKIANRSKYNMVHHGETENIMHHDQRGNNFVKQYAYEEQHHQPNGVFRHIEPRTESPIWGSRRSDREYSVN